MPPMWKAEFLLLVVYRRGFWAYQSKTPYCNLKKENQRRNTISISSNMSAL